MEESKPIEGEVVDAAPKTTPAEAAASSQSPGDAGAGSGRDAPDFDPEKPMRFRLKVMGVVLMVLGGIFLFQMYASAEFLNGAVDSLADEEGGSLELTVLEGGSMTAANYTFMAQDGTVFQNGTLAAGTGTFTDLARTTFTVRVDDGGVSVSREVFAPKDNTVKLTLDLTTPAAELSETAGPVPELPTYYWAIAIFPATMIAGGFASFRQQWRPLAYAGAGALAVAGLLLLNLFGFSLQPLIMMGFGVWAFWTMRKQAALFDTKKATTV